MARRSVQRIGGLSGENLFAEALKQLSSAAGSSLLERLQPNDRVVPGQRVTDHLKDHEVDFVVAIEGAGSVCLEVKGGDVWHDGDTWWRGDAATSTSIRSARPAKPAMRCANSLRRDERWTQGRLRWDHVVVLPNAEIADDFALPECPRWKVIDRNNVPTLVDKLKHVLVQQELDRPLLTSRASISSQRPERQGITATKRGRSRADQSGRRRRADRTSGCKQAIESNHLVAVAPRLFRRVPLRIIGSGLDH